MNRLRYALLYAVLLVVGLGAAGCTEEDRPPLPLPTEAYIQPGQYADVPPEDLFHDLIGKWRAHEVSGTLGHFSAAVHWNVHRSLAILSAPEVVQAEARHTAETNLLSPFEATLFEEIALRERWSSGLRITLRLVSATNSLERVLPSEVGGEIQRFMIETSTGEVWRTYEIVSWDPSYDDQWMAIATVKFPWDDPSDMFHEGVEWIRLHVVTGSTISGNLTFEWHFE